MAKVDAAEVAEPFRKQVREYVQERLGGVGPRLVAFLANSDPSAKKYAEWTGRACQEDGIRYEVRECQPEDLEDCLELANLDPDIHGIMIYYPVFGGFPSFFGGSQDDYLRDTVSMTKDVEGLCYTYRHNLYRNIRFADSEKTKKCVLPCTPLAVVKALEHMGVYAPGVEGDRLQGKTITIVNRSEIVGRPLAAMLANDGATIYSCDIDSTYVFRRGKLGLTTETQQSACLQSDVIILGVPSKAYKMDTAWIPDGCVVINVSSFKNVDEAQLALRESVRYVPLIGKVTVAMLERNLLRLYENFHHSKPA